MFLLLGVSLLTVKQIQFFLYFTDRVNSASKLFDFDS